ncbi:hypothetical protein PIB30_004974, partial [Stylosanthes scabra]|nr:hypothetical protein [Stylosanthes scabra]
MLSPTSESATPLVINADETTTLSRKDIFKTYTEASFTCIPSLSTRIPDANPPSLSPLLLPP